MLILAIDSSGQTAGAALVTDEAGGKVLAEFSLNCGYTHSQRLMPLIDGLLGLSGADKGDIDFVACSSGPGSFTGLRIGAGCAKGFAAGLGKKIVNVPTLDALAYNVLTPEKYAVPVMDARRGQVYGAVYTWENNKAGLLRLTDYLAESVEGIADIAGEISAKSGQKTKSITFLGDGASVHKEFLEARGFIIAPANNSLQRAGSVGLLALKKAETGEVLNPRDFKLFYVRKPQAEREAEAPNV